MAWTVITYRDVCEGHTRLGHLLELGLGPPKVHWAPSHAAHAAHASSRASLSTLSSAKQEKQPAESNEGEQDVPEEGDVVALLVTL